MLQRSVVVTNPTGLHARPAALFVKTAKGFPGASISVARDDRTADAKSILGVLTLAVTQGTTITICTDGDEAEAALAALVEAVEGGLGEPG
ncbi:MAG: HPr family phosphocarrier protein [Chloroflexota bacterium]